MELVLTTSSIHILTKTKLTTKKTNLNYFLCKYNIFLSKLQTFSAFLIKKAYIFNLYSLLYTKIYNLMYTILDVC